MQIPESKTNENFYVVAREHGQERTDLPTWADRRAGNIRFDEQPATDPHRRDIEGVPGAFQLLNLLSADECQQFMQITDALGYHLDAPVSLPHSVRHNTNTNWIVDESVDEPMWERARTLIPELVGGEPALGFNARFRFYRYAAGDYFKPHTDAAWPGSRVRGGELVHDAYGDRLSQMTCLIFLSDGFEGGRTQFYVNPNTGEPATNPDEMQIVSVVTPKGAALFFPHGFHPQHCLHAGEPVSAGVKYIIRTDVLFGVPGNRPTPL